MKRKTNIMKNHVMELTGLRVISMYTCEFFHWGWQEYDQQNDDGIDGEIIPRDKGGQDLGANIFVQSKCGPSFISSEDDDYITIHPYSDSKKLEEHVERWNRYAMPVILVYTNPEKINAKGKKYLDLKNPSAWWIRLDNYNYGTDGTSVIKIPKANKFQEHSKGFLYELVKPLLHNWNHYPLIGLDKPDKVLFSSMWLQKDAKNFYSQWAKKGSVIKWGNRSIEIKVSRVGWRHITDKSRKDRVALSMKLLPIAKKVLEHPLSNNPVVLKSDYGYKQGADTFTMHIGFRARVFLEDSEKKVQVVLKRHVCKRHGIEKIWFYSVHIIK